MDKHALYQYIDGKAADFCRVSDTVWDAAETAFEEKISAEALCQALEQEGFAVERGVAGIGHWLSGRVRRAVRPEPKGRRVPARAHHPG